MYNYTITRLSYLTVFAILFVSGICTGLLSGILIGLLERDALVWAGSAFFGMVAGLISGCTGLLYTFVFNQLAPRLGGFKINVSQIHPDCTPPNSEKPAAADS